MLTKIVRLALLPTAAALFACPSYGQAVTADIEFRLLDSVGAGWVTVDFINDYTSAPVVVCTYALPSAVSNDATIRMNNVTTTGFEVRVQQFETSNLVTASQVHCLIVKEGAHTLSGGHQIEAHKVLSDGTSGSAVGWGATTTENVTSSLVNTYPNMVVLGQVMTFNDAKASVFWTNNCISRNAAPTTTSFCVGKHIGMINSTRANETLGYIVSDTGTGTINDIDYAFAQGSDSIAGTGDSPPYSYTVTGDFDVGVLTQAAEDGGNGGWAVLYGADPLPNSRIRLAIEEETFQGDTSRRHTREPVYYGVFATNQNSDVNAAKTSAPFDPSQPYALPGSDVVYTLTISNAGTATVDQDTVFLVDSVPPEIEFFTGDLGAPGGGPVVFTPGGSGLTFNPMSDLGFSSAVAKPTNFSACNYTPVGTYDPDVRHICFYPKGHFNSGSFGVSEFEFEFRVRIK